MYGGRERRKAYAVVVADNASHIMWAGRATREGEGKNAKPLTLFWFVFAHKV